MVDSVAYIYRSLGSVVCLRTVFVSYDITDSVIVAALIGLVFTF
jgi:hypothetical protein